MGHIADDGIVRPVMGVADRLPDPDRAPRCAYCGGVIGVYEPLVQVLSHLVLTTSRAADPSLSADTPGELYHARCHELSRAPADT